MRGVIKQDCPAPLANWLALSNENWTPTYGEFRGPPKTGTHSSLLTEQMGVCVYCGRALRPDRNDSHIDHFRPQARFNADNPPDLTLSYSNLVVSCGPDRYPVGHPLRRNATCGESKGDWFDNDCHIDPTEENCQARFSYGMSGEIFPSSTRDVAAKTMIEVLNLNEKSLSYERNVIVLGIESQINDGTINVENMQNEIELFRMANQNGFALSLSHVAARYIEDEFQI